MTNRIARNKRADGAAPSASARVARSSATMSPATSRLDGNATAMVSANGACTKRVTP
jgi:hypothetical protein